MNAIRLPTFPDWFSQDLRWITASRAARSISQGYLSVIVVLYLLQLNFNAVSLGELFTIGAIISSLLTVGVSLLADQYGRKLFLIFFPLLTVVAGFVFISTKDFWILVAAVVYFFRMVSQRLSIPLRQSYSMGVVDKEERSAAAGISNLPSQMSSAVSPLISGYIFENLSLELPFEIAAVLQLINAAVFYSLFRNIRPPEETARLAETLPSVEILPTQSTPRRNP